MDKNYKFSHAQRTCPTTVCGGAGSLYFKSLYDVRQVRLFILIKRRNIRYVDDGTGLITQNGLTDLGK